MSDSRFPGFTPIRAIERPSLRTLWRWHQQGRIRFYEFGREKFVKDDEFVPRPVQTADERNGRKRRGADK